MEIHVAEKTQGLFMCGNDHHQKKVAASIISQLKFIYTSAHSVPTNRRSRELENQDIAAILET